MTLCICGAATLFADDNVRALQTQLKSDGFYFGEVSGVYDSQTGAAVSRYQIRNGLPISGQLDPETAKSLGVAAGGSAGSGSADTWQRLRKTDRQFLEKLNSAQRPVAAPPAKASPRPASSPATAGKPASLLQPADDGATVVLSRERLRDYVAAFVLAGLDPHVGAELEFFGPRVNYYGDGVTGRERIRRDLLRYDQQWPQRRFWLAGEVNVQPQPDSTIRVVFPLRFDLRNGARHSSGRVVKTLLLEVTGDDLQIVAVNERKAR